MILNEVLLILVILAVDDIIAIGVRVILEGSVERAEGIVIYIAPPIGIGIATLM